jgi:hypothetical protein
LGAGLCVGNTPSRREQVNKKIGERTKRQITTDEGILDGPNHGNTFPYIIRYIRYRFIGVQVTADFPLDLESRLLRICSI